MSVKAVAAITELKSTHLLPQITHIEDEINSKTSKRFLNSLYAYIYLEFMAQNKFSVEFYF